MVWNPGVSMRTIAGGASRLSRRHVLGGTMAAAGLAALGLGARTTRSAPQQQATPVSGVTGAPLTEPPVLRSTDGRLELALEAQYGPATLGGRPVTTYSYNGMIPGPTLRLRAGETLAPTLTNRLDAVTNLHTHGLHVSPAGNSDNVLLEIAPGETVDFAFDIPASGASGLYIPGFYWYHPHIHGNTAIQVGGGMAGALVVEGALDDLPGIAGVPERIMVLGTSEFADDGTLKLFADMLNPAVFVNGQEQPTIAIAPGETQRWRIVNASVFTFLDLALEGHLLHQIASDGNPLRALRSREHIVVAPGERIEVLIQGGPAGSYALRSLAWGQDTDFQAQDEYPIATLVSDGEEQEPAPLPDALFPFEDLREATVDRKREVVFSETLDPFRLFIDGKQFDHDRVDQTVLLGALEEWRIVNTSPDWHPFHIHVNDFQVIEVNGEPYEAHSWEDTFPLPAFGEVVIRSRFLDFTGKYVYHCHILDHEDMGMMGIVEVVAPG
ncbi:MAG: multicopper oxidase family protein [Thermomicrobiales bacterium]